MCCVCVCVRVCVRASVRLRDRRALSMTTFHVWGILQNRNAEIERGSGDIALWSVSGPICFLQSLPCPASRLRAPKANKPVPVRD